MSDAVILNNVNPSTIDVGGGAAFGLISIPDIVPAGGFHVQVGYSEDAYSDISWPDGRLTPHFHAGGWRISGNYQAVFNGDQNQHQLDLRLGASLLMIPEFNVGISYLHADRFNGLGPRFGGRVPIALGDATDPETPRLFIEGGASLLWSVENGNFFVFPDASVGVSFPFEL